MTTALTDDGVRLTCRIDGPANAPIVLFVNSLGTDLRMWEPQAAALADHPRERAASRRAASSIESALASTPMTGASGRSAAVGSTSRPSPVPRSTTTREYVAARAAA